MVTYFVDKHGKSIVVSGSKIVQKNSGKEEKVGEKGDSWMEKGIYGIFLVLAILLNGKGRRYGNAIQEVNGDNKRLKCFG